MYILRINKKAIQIIWFTGKINILIYTVTFEKNYCNKNILLQK